MDQIFIESRYKCLSRGITLDCVIWADWIYMYLNTPPRTDLPLKQISLKPRWQDVGKSIKGYVHLRFWVWSVVLLYLSQAFHPQ